MVCVYMRSLIVSQPSSKSFRLKTYKDGRRVCQFYNDRPSVLDTIPSRCYFADSRKSVEQGVESSCVFLHGMLMYISFPGMITIFLFKNT